MYPESLEHHHGRQNPNGIHGTVLQVRESFDAINIADSKLSHNDRADTVPNQNEHDVRCECKRTHHTVDAERQVDDFQKHHLGPVAHSPNALHHLLFQALCVLLESVREEENAETQSRRQHQVGGFLGISGLPKSEENSRKRQRGGCMEPDFPEVQSKTLKPRKTKFLFFGQQPKHEEQQQESPAAEHQIRS